MRIFHGVAAVMALAPLALLAAAQAQTAPPAPAASPATGGAAKMPRLSPEQVLAAFVPGEGREVTATACGSCHLPTIITGKKYDAEGWSKVVDQMLDRGATVADDDYDTVVKYLATHYGP